MDEMPSLSFYYIHAYVLLGFINAIQILFKLTFYGCINFFHLSATYKYRIINCHLIRTLFRNKMKEEMYMSVIEIMKWYLFRDETYLNSYLIFVCVKKFYVEVFCHDPNMSTSSQLWKVNPCKLNTRK